MVALLEEISVEVVELYPSPKKKKGSEKFQEAGTCHIVLNIGELSMEIKNIMYKLSNSGSFWVGMPGRHHPYPSKGEDAHVFVPTITFSDPAISAKIKEEIEKEFRAISQ